MVNLVAYYKSSSLLNRSCGMLGRHNLPQKADESTIAEMSTLRVAYFMQYEMNLCGSPVRNGSIYGEQSPVSWNGM